MAEQEKALIVIEKNQVAAVFVKDGLDPFIEKIKKEVEGFEGDLNTSKGRTEITSLAFKVIKSKTLLQKAGRSLIKQKKEEISGVTKQIDIIRAEDKRMTTELDAIANEVKKPLNEWKDAEEVKKKAEEERIEAIKDNINGIKQYLPLAADGSFCPLHLATSKQIDTAMAKLIDLDMTIFYEFQDEAHLAYNLKMSELEDAGLLAAQKEEVIVEKKRLADEETERQKKANDKKITDKAKDDERLRLEEENQKERDNLKEKEMRAKLETERLEQEKKEMAEHVEKKKKEALEKADRDKVQALEDERKRIKAKEASKIRADKERAANTEHCLKINTEVFEALKKAGWDPQIAGQILELLISGKLPHISINY